MMTDQDTDAEKYAELLIRVGVNVQPDRPVMISAGLDVAPFVRTLVRQAYAAGASYVHVHWSDSEISRLNMQHASHEQLSTYPAWEAAAWMQLVEQDAAFIYISSPDPAAYAGLDPQRLTLRAQAQAQAFHPSWQALEAKQGHWLVAAALTTPWATLVFPDLPASMALARLWGLISKATRLDAADPIAAWTEHLAHLRRRCASLNAARLRRLHYRAPGTDLTVELLPGSIWVGGASQDKQGLAFVPNMPTDEVFTTPLRSGTQGTVRSTLPLYYNGVLIKDITLRFEQGKIVYASASTGLEVLRGALDTDEGARFLGEVSLVPVDSPLARMETVFYSTLFDENASCHLAFGNGYAVGLQGGEEMTPDQLVAAGVNQSATHVDLMVGSAHLDVDGETEAGETIPLLRQGRWAMPLE